MPRAWRGLVVLLLFLFGPPARSAAAQPAADPAALAADQGTARLDFSAALAISGKELKLGFARVILDEGQLVPVVTTGGWRLQLVFVGAGRLVAEPPDTIEAAQLELFTGRRRLDVGFSAAIFAAPEKRLAELAAGALPVRAGAEETAQARAIFEGQAELAELSVLDVDRKLLLAALGEPLAEDYFAAVFDSDGLGVICLGNDLEAEDPLGIGQWVELESAAEEPAAAAGRTTGEDAEEAEDAGGAYDAWVEGRDSSRPAPPVNATFEPRHYRLEVALDPAAGTLHGRAEIALEAQLPSRVVKLSLHGDLEVAAVADGEGHELYFLRDGEDLRVFLPYRLAPGATTRIEVTYSGQFFESGKRRKSRGLRDNVAFYPHAGEIDEATYDLKLRWPRGWELLAAGDLVAEGKDAQGSWQERKIAAPTWGPTFAVGKFRRASRDAGGVHIELALGAGLGASEADQREILDAAASSLQYFSELFGPYPLDRLTLTSAPAEISQSLLGFIALSDEMMQASGHEAAELGLEDRRTVVAHEIAHQWWGHQIGWRRWRDQWISEAMANYAALLWARKYLPDLDPAIGPTGGWQDDLTSMLPNGRSLESVGPLVLGGRLDSSLTEEAYEPIVYRKGAVVLDSLCGFWGERRCLEMIGKLARSSRGRKLSTAELIFELEKLSGRDLETFAGQFIYGTGLPEVYYRRQVEKTPAGRWRVAVEAELESSYHFRYALRAVPGGQPAIVRQRVDEVDLASLALVAPLELELAEPGAKAIAHVEKFEIHGPRAEIAFEFAEEPKTVTLDPGQNVFARFWNLDDDAKRALYYRGFDRLAAGDLAAAGRFLGEALAFQRPPAEAKENENIDRALDASIQIAQARLALERDDLAAAGAALAAARKLVPKALLSLYSGDLDYLAAVLMWRQGKAEAAYTSLNRLLLEKAVIDDTEAWLYLALAARAAGHDQQLEEALVEARARGVDIKLLEDES